MSAFFEFPTENAREILPDHLEPVEALASPNVYFLGAFASDRGAPVGCGESSIFAGAFTCSTSKMSAMWRKKPVRGSAFNVGIELVGTTVLLGGRFPVAPNAAARKARARSRLPKHGTFAARSVSMSIIRVMGS